MAAPDPVCVVCALHDILATLEQGRTAMAATLLRALTIMVETHAGDLDRQDVPPILPEPRTATGPAGRQVARLRRLLAHAPKLREVAAATLKVRLDDIDAIVAGRVQLSRGQWKRLWPVLIERFLALA